MKFLNFCLKTNYEHYDLLNVLQKNMEDDNQ